MSCIYYRVSYAIWNVKLISKFFLKKMFNLFSLFYPIYIRVPLCILEKPEMTFQDAAIIDLRKPEMTFYKWGPLWTPQKPEMLFCFLLAFLGRRYSAHFDAKPHTLSVYLVVIYTLSSLRRFVKYILKKYWIKPLNITGIVPAIMILEEISLDSFVLNSIADCFLFSHFAWKIFFQIPLGRLG